MTLTTQPCSGADAGSASIQPPPARPSSSLHRRRSTSPASAERRGSPRREVWRTAWVVLAVSALLAALSACSDSDSGDSASKGTDHNSADVAFATNMIPHHAQAIEMADLAMTRARSPQVKDLAIQIKAAQQPEIDTMTGWLEDWGEPVPDPESMSGMDHDMSGMDSMKAMEGMMSAADMERLASTTGTAFDTMWLSMMVEHHQGAIDMAKIEVADGVFAEATALADGIITTQQDEIDTMKQLGDDLAD